MKPIEKGRERVHHGWWWNHINGKAGLVVVELPAGGAATEREREREREGEFDQMEATHLNIYI
jgi:hypothetical protein